ncbi:MAG: hypothetical protein K2X77_23885 [Candidatus Obscuribacterales bacterium]|jgi:hypothetical protein|nr:hypothetical protein [Candidatus Obscuribacterales bacterium]
MAKGLVLTKDALKTFIIESAKGCIHPAEGSFHYRYVTPTIAVRPGADDSSDVPERSRVGHYLQMYDWDSCFFSQAAWRAGADGLALDVLRNFLSLQDKDGYIPRTVSPSRIWDKGDLCKPFLAQTCLAEYKRTQDVRYKLGPSEILGLDCYYKYFAETRRHSSGLYHWRNVLESGIDDNLALLYPLEAEKDENDEPGRFPDGELLASDLNAYLFAEYNAFADLCELSKDGRRAQEYRDRAKEIQELVEKYLWIEELGMYGNYHPRLKKQVKLRAWSGLCPVFFGLANDDRSNRTIKTNIMNEEHFLRPCGLASLAASENLYSQSKRGLYGRVIVSHWQGPMWILPNALASRMLVKRGLNAEAKKIASATCGAVEKVLEATGTMYENYNAETAAPLWAPDFMSWNILLLELLEQR